MTRIGTLIVFFVSACLMGLYSVSKGSDASFDLKSYHFYNAFASLHGRYSFDFYAAFIQGYLNPFLDYPFYGLILWLNDFPRVIAFIQGALHGANVVCVAIIAWHLVGHRLVLPTWHRLALTLLATIIGATGAGGLSVVGTTTNDIQSAIPCMIALTCFIIAIDRAHALDGTPLPHPKVVRCIYALLAWAGFAMGMAAGSKLTSVIYAIALTANLPFLPRRFLFKGFVWFGVSSVIGVLISAGPHFVKMYSEFQNPLFPFYNDIFKSPYYDSVRVADLRFIPKSAIEYFTYPFLWGQSTGAALVTELHMRDLRTAVTLVLGIIAMVFLVVTHFTARRPATPRDTNYGTATLITFVVVSHVIWITSFAIYRYYIPVEMLTGILIVLALEVVLTRMTVLIATIGVAAFCIRTTMIPNWGHVAFGKQYLSVAAPPMPPNTFALISSTNPMSYVIPFFGNDIRWAGLSNIMPLDKKNLLAMKFEAAVKEHTGKFVLVRDGLLDQRLIDVALNKYGLERTDEACLDAQSNIEIPPVEVCHLVRVTGNGPNNPRQHNNRETPGVTLEMKARILAYGPTEIVHAEPFNRQPNGSSAIWIKMDRPADPRSVVMLGGTKLVTFVNGESIAALVPDDVIAQPQDFQLSVEIVSEGSISRSNVVSFKIR
jgi:hypothetical protein